MIDSSTIKTILLRYGNRFLINGDADSFFYGIISPKKSHALSNQRFERIGVLSDNDLILVYPFDELRLSESDSSHLSMLDKSYCIKCCDAFYLCGKPLYRFALLSEKWYEALDSQPAAIKGDG